MKKTNYYLWRALYATEEEYEAEKIRIKGAGYRVVTYTEESGKQRLLEGLMGIVENHCFSNRKGSGL